MSKWNLLLLAGAVVTGSCVSLTTYASPLNVTDCAGVSRAAADISESQARDVTIALSGENGALVSGSEIILSEQKTGRKLSADVVNGAAHFPNVSSGVWRACYEQQGFSVRNVTLRENASAHRGSGLLLGGSAVAGGVALAAVSFGSNGGSNSSSTDLSGTSLSATSEAGPIAPAKSSAASSRPSNRATQSRDCLNTATPQPISPFR